MEKLIYVQKIELTIAHEDDQEATSCVAGPTIGLDEFLSSPEIHEALLRYGYIKLADLPEIRKSEEGVPLFGVVITHDGYKGRYYSLMNSVLKPTVEEAMNAVSSYGVGLNNDVFVVQVLNEDKLNITPASRKAFDKVKNRKKYAILRAEQSKKSKEEKEAAKKAKRIAAAKKLLEKEGINVQTS